MVFDTIWPPQQELEAACNRLMGKLRVPLPWRRDTAHDVPFRRCTCGIYASEALEIAAGYLYLYDDVRQPDVRHRAIGRVSLWGSVVEGETGWRASRAYPERIFLPRTDGSGRLTDVESIVEGLSEYGVPVEIVDDERDDPVAAAVRGVRPERRRQRRAKTSS
jgi:hypothetical protein